MRSASILAIPDGRAGLDAKVAEIRRLVEAAKRDPRFRDAVHELLRGLPEKNNTAEIVALVEHVRRGVRYMRDPAGVEFFVEPQTMLRDIDAGTAAGDCDDHVLLASALLETAGYPTRYRIGGDPPDQYRHIWLDVQHPRNGWTAVELTKKDAPVGFDPSRRFPLTLTLGASTMDPWERDLRARGINPRFAYAQGGSATAEGGLRMRSAETADDGLTYQQRYRKVEAQVSADRVRSAAERRSAERRRRGLGDGDVPPSFRNVVPVAPTALPYGATPSDFLRAVDTSRIDPSELFGLGSDPDDLLDDDGGLGFLKRLRKKHKKLRKRILGRVLKKSPVRRLVRRKKSRGRVTGGGAMIDPNLPVQEPGEASIMPVPTVPPMTGSEAGFVEQSGGWALPPGVPDQTTVTDAQPAMPMPVGVPGSYTPATDWPAPGNPYAEPAESDSQPFPIDAEPGFDDVEEGDDVAPAYGTLGALALGSWKDVLTEGAKAYAESRRAYLQRRGINLPGSQPPPMIQTPQSGFSPLVLGAAAAAGLALIMLLRR